MDELDYILLNKQNMNSPCSSSLKVKSMIMVFGLVSIKFELKDFSCSIDEAVGAEGLVPCEIDRLDKNSIA